MRCTPLEHEELFTEILDSLNLRKIYIKHFTAEQIFYQLEEASEDAIRKLAIEVDGQYRRYSRDIQDGRVRAPSSRRDESGALAEERSHDMSDSAELLAEPSESASGDTSLAGSGDASGNSSASTSLAGSECASVDESDCAPEDFQYISEEEDEIKDINWDSSGSSFDELVSLPADSVVKILSSKAGSFKTK